MFASQPQQLYPHMLHGGIFSHKTGSSWGFYVGKYSSPRVPWSKVRWGNIAGWSSIHFHRDLCTHWKDSYHGMDDHKQFIPLQSIFECLQWFYFPYLPLQFSQTWWMPIINSHYLPIIFPVYSQHIPIFRPYIILEVRNTHDIPIIYIYTNYNIYIDVWVKIGGLLLVDFIILHSDFPWYAHYVPTIHPIVGEIHHCYQWLFQGPKLKVPTIDKAYVRPRLQETSPQNMALHGTVPPF